MIYIGSTVLPLKKRFTYDRCHSRVENYKRRPLYTIVNEKYGGDWSTFYIELYETCPCNNKEELDRKEGYMIRELMSGDMHVLNKNIAGRTVKEYYQNNIEKYQQYYKANAYKYKQYYLDHKEEKLAYQKHYYDKKKDGFTVHFE